MTEIDDIQNFIAAQKRRIEQERAGLAETRITSRLNDNLTSYEQVDQSPRKISSVRKQEEPQKAKEGYSSLQGGLQFGAYENVKEKLQKERAEEYRKFLAEKKYRTTGEKAPRGNETRKIKEKPPTKSAMKQDFDSAYDAQTNVYPRYLSNGDDLRDTQRRTYNDLAEQHNARQASVRNDRLPKTLDELYDAYEELLERKRQDERRYRNEIDDPYSDPRHVRFEDESRRTSQKQTWLQNGTRRRWDLPEKVDGHDLRLRNMDNDKFRSMDDQRVKRRESREENSDNRISRSAPPFAIPLIGEKDITPEVKQKRQSKYREELQAQMKEREIQKKREKGLLPHENASVKREAGPNSTVNVGQEFRRYDPSFPVHEHVQREQMYKDYPRIPSPRYQSHYPAPEIRAIGPNQFAYDQRYHAGYMNPTQHNGLSNPHPIDHAFSSLKSNSTSFIEPSTNAEPLVRAYQPSWVPDSFSQGAMGNRNPPILNRPNPLSNGLSDQGFGFGSGFDTSPIVDSRNRQQLYREELSKQLKEKEERKKKNKEELERYNLKLEREVEVYNPWGKSGGGAPIRDPSGNLVSDLRQMHQYNKEGTIISPRDYGKTEDSSLLKNIPNRDGESKSAEGDATATVDRVMASQGNDTVRKNPQIEYKEFLKQQVEEKQRKKKEEQDRIREIEEKQEKLIEEQQKKLREEYEKELQAAKDKEEAARKKNEELRKAAEEKKKEIERKRLEEDRKQEEKLRKQLDERLKAAKANYDSQSIKSQPPAEKNSVRANSPPIPTLRNKVDQTQKPSSPPIQTLQTKTKAAPSPVPAVQNKASKQQSSIDDQLPPSTSTKRRRQKGNSHSNLFEHFELDDGQDVRLRPSSSTADIDVLSQLTSLRRQLKKEELKVQQQLSENKEKYVQLRENSANRRTKKPAFGNVFDNVFRKQNGSAQMYHDAQVNDAIIEFNKLKYEDSSSLSGDFLSRYPEPVTSSSALDVQQKSLLNEQQQRLETLHDATLSSDKENLDFLGNIGRPSSNTTLLQSDSQFVPVVESNSHPPADDAVKFPPRLKSARERRRWKQLQDLAKAPKLSDFKSVTPDGSSLSSATSFNVDELAQKNEERLRRLEAMKRARAESKGDPNEVLKRFIEEHSRPHSKISENSLPADKKYLSKM
ncbi:centrosome and spindle pole-associated protein 1-like isoform X3 [Xenia sp. Carnegie-2017]|uniref:centrosome and spindle pole-associated protein 1-like isoform X3 n=1 Tax=Xenia sp. Carnegie-2017 TaxID=2897299 RepID=UPI001F03B61B|nr:centrosome and spindle pole-associated protein 1-like isoform X3 [Xenia sp. Carnegie-2017]